MQADKPASSTLTVIQFLDEALSRSSPCCGRQRFFPSNTFKAWLSKVDSARSCFRRRFSSSSCLRRLASLTSIPPYFLRQLKKVPLEMPFSRQRSAMGRPASASLRVAMICSSVNRLRFMASSIRLIPGRTAIQSGQVLRGQVTKYRAPLHRIKKERVARPFATIKIC